MTTYHRRLTILQKYLEAIPCDALLIDDKTNLYYLTGLDLSAGKLLVHSQGAQLFVDNRYFESCQKNSPFPVLPSDTPSLESHLNSPFLAHIHTLAFDSTKTSYSNFQALQEHLQRSPITLIPLDNPLRQQRTLKDPDEIHFLQQAATLGSQGFDYICSLLTEGITEQTLACELEIFWKRHGAKGLAFDPIIAFGPHSSMPHYRAGNTRLQPEQVVLIDIGVNFQHYHSDMTRTLFFGPPPKQLVEVYSIVQQAQQAALNLCRPGTTLGALDTAARQIIADHGYANNFIHSLGHGIGLDIHEYPLIKNQPPYNAIPLAAGMVITIEPGIYLPELGGIRLEDTVVITENGHINLTQRPTDLTCALKF